MQHCNRLDDGFVIQPKTQELLAAAKRVTVVTNSRALPADYFQRITPGAGEVFVIFNRHRFALGEHLAARTIWVHRLDEASGLYFGNSAPAEPTFRAFHHLSIAGDSPAHARGIGDGSYLSYRAALPSLADYPVGRPILPAHGIRRIVSPSTGFVVFSLLDELQARGAVFCIRAVGVGREYNGWPGHDWVFERRKLLRTTIDFRTADGRPDRWHGFLDGVPFCIMRALWKVRAALRRERATPTAA